jgi:hypothetical protein
MEKRRKKGVATLQLAAAQTRIVVLLGDGLIHSYLFQKEKDGIFQGS